MTISVHLITQTPNPQKVIYAAMHQDYSSHFVGDTRDNWPDEKQCGDVIVKRLLKGDRGHYGCLEHPSITLGCAGFPHSVIQQATRHRLLSFDVQSMRYTSQSVMDVITLGDDVEEVFYFRPVGQYKDRQGKSYEYTEAMREDDKQYCYDAALRYWNRFGDGMSEEHAREMIPYAIRQHFVMSGNLRSILHFMDLRAKKDAQLEIQNLCEMIWPHIKAWVPEIAEWYEVNRLGKARLAP
jgi:thymidylate synthase (FAD)